MSFNKKILAVAIAGILPGAAFAFVDLNTGVGVPSFASEVAIPVGGLALSNVPTELNVHVLSGFGVSPGQTRFIRFDYAGAKLNTAVVGADFSIIGTGAGSAMTVVDGGDLVKEYVIVQVTASPAGILPTDTIVFQPSTSAVTPPTTGGAVKVFNQNPQVIKYALYEFAANAVSQTGPLSGPLSGNWFNWISGIAAACAPTAGGVLKIDASNPKLFVGPSIHVSNIFDISLNTTAALLPSTGLSAGGLASYMGPTSSIKATGSLFGQLSLTSPLGGGTFAADVSNTFGTWSNVSTTIPTTTVQGTTTGAVAMLASTYSVLINPAPGTLATINPIDLGVCGRLEFSGSSDRVDFGLTPGAGNKQFLRITNPTKDSGAVNVTVWNDNGVPPNNTVTFPLSAVKVGAAPGVNLPGILGAFASTPLIDVNAFDAAAKSVNAAFSVGTGIDGKPGKIRIEVRGDFGDNLIDGNGNETAPILKKGIYLQAVNNGQYHQ